MGWWPAKNFYKNIKSLDIQLINILLSHEFLRKILATFRRNREFYTLFINITPSQYLFISLEGTHQIVVTRALSNGQISLLKFREFPFPQLSHRPLQLNGPVY